MTVTVSELNDLPSAAAADLFRSCCGATRWIEAMIARRPFGSLDDVLMAADQVWASTSATDWHEAFEHHPRIGGTRSVSAQTDRAAAWSAGEQAAVAVARTDILKDLATINREYENRFGHLYIVCASGRSAEELLSVAKQRLGNGPDLELQIAADEQRQITRFRLRKLLEGPT